MMSRILGGVGNRLSVQGPVKPGLVRAQAGLAGREGFVIPAVIFSLVLMSTLAIAALLTAEDEMRASRAVRESVLAMYAAEAGLNEVWATWDDTLVNTLNPGDSLDLGWKTLPNGSSYRAVLRRFDNGGQEIYGLTAEGRGRGAFAGQRLISLSLSKSAPSEFCCSAAVRGRAAVEIANATVNGFDSIPAPWAGVCPSTLEDKPGMEWNGSVDLDQATVTGNPPLVNDPTINSTNLFDWGDLTYDDLAAMADITLDGDAGRIGPRLSGGNCNTSNRYNWGAPEDPSHPCFNYFPIIHANELEIENGSVGQGILLVDAELRIENTFTFYGIMIIKQETEFEGNVTIHGGLIINGEFEGEAGPTVQYSGCAVNRAITSSSASSSLVSVELLSSRAWGQALR